MAKGTVIKYEPMIQLTLTRNEARLIYEMMQNPIEEMGESLNAERESIFEAVYEFRDMICPELGTHIR